MILKKAYTIPSQAIPETSSRDLPSSAIFGNGGPNEPGFGLLGLNFGDGGTPPLPLPAHPNSSRGIPVWRGFQRPMNPQHRYCRQPNRSTLLHFFFAVKVFCSGSLELAYRAVGIGTVTKNKLLAAVR